MDPFPPSPPPRTCFQSALSSIRLWLGQLGQYVQKLSRVDLRKGVEWMMDVIKGEEAAKGEGTCPWEGIDHECGGLVCRVDVIVFGCFISRNRNIGQRACGEDSFRNFKRVYRVRVADDVIVGKD